MADKAWKKRERQVARWFGVQRVPGSGCDAKYGRSSASDSTHGALFVEVKLRKKHTVVTLWDSVKVKARQEGKVPVVALAEGGRPGWWLLVHCDDAEAVLWERLEVLYGSAAVDRARGCLGNSK